MALLQERTTTRNSLDAGRLAVAVRGVCKAFDGGGAKTQVLDRVDLSIEQGQCLFLLGPSGSGKTTLMSIIGCLLTADAGEVRVLGAEVSGLSPQQRADLRRRQIGFVFQKYHLIRGLSAAENVAVPLKLDGEADDVAEAKSLQLLERVGLAEKAHESPSRMSVGQCQRVAVARALAADPPLVLADEPTAALDAVAGRQAMQLLRELTVESGKTLVVVTHDHRILPAAGSPDRIVAMDSGRLVEAAETPGRRSKNAR